MNITFDITLHWGKVNITLPSVLKVTHLTPSLIGLHWRARKPINSTTTEEQTRTRGW